MEAVKGKVREVAHWPVLLSLRTSLLDLRIIKDNESIWKAAEEKTGLPLQILVIALTVAVALLFRFNAPLATDLLGFAYPTYATLRAIETTDKTDDTAWLTYWILFASLFLLENAFETVFSSQLSCYYLHKSFFLLWCMAGVERGGERREGEDSLPLINAQRAYSVSLGPLYESHQPLIDEALLRSLLYQRNTATSDN